MQKEGVKDSKTSNHINSILRLIAVSPSRYIKQQITPSTFVLLSVLLASFSFQHYWIRINVSYRQTTTTLKMMTVGGKYEQERKKSTKREREREIKEIREIVFVCDLYWIIPFNS